MVVSFERRPRVVTPFTWNVERVVAGLDIDLYDNALGSPSWALPPFSRVP
jgi:hypothetical protein